MHQLYSQMQVGQDKNGMVTLSQSLLNLHTRGLISRESALLAATESEELERMLGIAVDEKHPARTPSARITLAR